MEDMKAADVARELHDMTPERRAEVASALDDQKLADALEELPEDEQVQLISELDTERAADILEEMDPDDAADLIAELAPGAGRAAAGPDGAGRGQGRPPAAQLRRVHRRRHDDARSRSSCRRTPRWPTPWRRIRDADLTPALACMVYVCRSPLETPTGRFIGAVHFQRLLREPPSTLVSALVDTDLETLHRRRQPARRQPLLRDVQPGQRARWWTPSTG